MKKLAFPILLLFSICMFSACSKPSQEYIVENTDYAYMNNESHEELQSKCEDKEQIEIAKKIIKDSEKAFKTSLQEASNYDFGACSTYCPDESVLKRSENIDLSIEYMNTKQDSDSGYIWVKYSVDYYDKAGEIICGRHDAVARWEIKKDGFEWKVVKITEAY